MNILSLFDGCSCGKVALERAGIPIQHYFASEIDKHAIQISKKNHPDIIHLGDVKNIKASALPKIDLVLAGSPCQGFSTSGVGMGFDDPRSRLFWEFVRLVDELKPEYWLLENVRMKPEWRDIISEAVGCEPILINSALVSAQRRMRYYWTNIPMAQLPTNKGLVINDILEEPIPTEQKYNTPEQVGLTEAGGNFHQTRRIYSPAGKSPTLTAAHAAIPKIITSYGTRLIGRAAESDYVLTDRVYSVDGKSPCVVTTGPPKVGNLVPEPYVLNSTSSQLDRVRIIKREHWRHLTPVECERLQTLPDGYTEGVSRSQRHRMLGNGWTCDVICHILSGLKKDAKQGSTQGDSDK
jgi:site-specific DNA-cytosine methylase